MELCVLGSGSSGNASILRVGAKLMMIDGGLGPRAAARRLAAVGGRLDDLAGLIVTHLDRDHFTPTWFNTLAERNVPLWCHERHLYDLYRHRPTTVAGLDARQLHQRGLLRTFTDQPFEMDLASAEALHVTPCRLDHDRQGTIGYRIEHLGYALGYATDLGRVPDRLIDLFVDADLLAIESNYDPAMQRRSDRPAMLKRRIMGGAGHLSNQQAAEAVVAIARRSRRAPSRIALLHLSRQCNRPDLALEAFGLYADLIDRIEVTSQTSPSAWLSVSGAHQPLVGEQLRMF